MKNVKTIIPCRCVRCTGLIDGTSNAALDITENGIEFEIIENTALHASSINFIQLSSRTHLEEL